MNVHYYSAHCNLHRAVSKIVSRLDETQQRASLEHPIKNRVILPFDFEQNRRLELARDRFWVEISVVPEKLCLQLFLLLRVVAVMVVVACNERFDGRAIEIVNSGEGRNSAVVPVKYQFCNKTQEIDVCPVVLLFHYHRCQAEIVKVVWCPC